FPAHVLGLVLAVAVTSAYREPAWLGAVAEARQVRPPEQHAGPSAPGPEATPPAEELTARREIARQVIAGPPTLPEAAAAYRRTAGPAVRGMVRRDPGCPSEGEHWCRLVIKRVGEQLAGDCRPAGAVLAGLERELEAARGPTGAVALPGG